MQPDTDTESDEGERDDDEEYQTLLSTAGMVHIHWQKPANICVKHTFKPTDVGATSLDDVLADSALLTDAE
eukprot:12918543-Prorocentrum_lima.AAC.1